MATTIPILSIAKPAYGERCNGCGHCCVNEVCMLGQELGDSEVCRALISNTDGTFACGLVSDPYRYVPEERTRTWRMIDELQAGAGEAAFKAYHAQMLGAGHGCDSD